MGIIRASSKNLTLSINELIFVIDYNPSTKIAAGDFEWCLNLKLQLDVTNFCCRTSLSNDSIKKNIENRKEILNEKHYIVRN